jgi:hypothetical protein
MKVNLRNRSTEMTKTTTFSTTPTSNSAECFVWRGWLKMDALVRAEMRFDTMRGGEGMTTPVFQLAQSRPRSYGASVLHAMVDGEALCGRPTPEFPDEGCRVVAFWTSQEDDAPKCKRCLKRSADPTLDRALSRLGMI